MKHMRKALSLLLVLAMVVCFAVPAFAASPEGATVTVYITEDLFTKGGIDTATGKKIDQEYIGGIPTSYIKKVEVDISGISTTELKTLKASYNNPDAETQTTVSGLCPVCRAFAGYLYRISDPAHHQCTDGMAALRLRLPCQHQPGNLHCPDHGSVWPCVAGKIGSSEAAIWYGE